MAGSACEWREEEIKSLIKKESEKIIDEKLKQILKRIKDIEFKLDFYCAR
jgi:hypothetical protein